MGVWQMQSVLNRGELDPLTLGRVDLQQYYNGCSLCSNVLAMPQGGLTKRPGTSFITSISESSSRLERFAYDVDTNYLLVFLPLSVQIFNGGTLVDTLTTPWDSTQIKEFDFIQSADTIIITHPDIEYRKIVRVSDTSWTISTLTVTDIPQYDFNDASSPTPTSATQNIQLFNYNPGDRFKISLEGLLTDEIVLNSSSLSGMDSTVNAMKEALLDLPNTASDGITIGHSYPVVIAFQIIFSGSSAKDWDDMIITPVSTQNSAFYGDTGTSVTGVSRAEDAWSSTRGWPSTCTFHEGRLYFGGSKSRPQTIWGSVVNDYFNFKTRKGLADESLSATIDTDQLNTIQGIFSNRSLQVFTSGSEFYVPASPITPENIAIAPQSSYGSKRIRPVTIDGVTLFAQRTGKAILQFVFVDESQANQTTSVSVLAPHLIDEPIKLVVSRGSEDSDANYVYILNSTGNIAVFNTLAAQEVAGFTRWESDGTIEDITVVDNSLYLAVKRTIGGSTQIHIEKENDDFYMDATVTASGSGLTSISGLSHLEGQTVAVKADDYFYGLETVSSGSVTLDYDADYIEAGVMFTPDIWTMPLNFNLQNGSNIAQRKKIMRVSLQVHESNGIIVNRQRIADKTMGVDVFSAPEPYSGLKTMYLSGWTTEAVLKVTQLEPLPFTILGIGMEVKV